jgi:hypothetical protein
MQGGTATVLRGGATSVLANDTGLADIPVAVAVQTPPRFAADFLLNPDGTFRYIHDGSQNLSDSFVYRITDNDGQTATATVAIMIAAHVVAGDFNRDGRVDGRDIDLLVAALSASSQDASFDLDSNRRVDAGDLDYLVESILNTRRGDADLDGDVDFADFVTLSFRYGAGVANWGQGDFDADRTVSFSDFVTLASNFGFGEPR